MGGQFDPQGQLLEKSSYWTTLMACQLHILLEESLLLTKVYLVVRQNVSWLFPILIDYNPTTKILHILMNRMLIPNIRTRPSMFAALGEVLLLGSAAPALQIPSSGSKISVESR